jgi:hypothetical protein
MIVRPAKAHSWADTSVACASENIAEETTRDAYEGNFELACRNMTLVIRVTCTALPLH